MVVTMIGHNSEVAHTQVVVKTGWTAVAMLASCLNFQSHFQTVLLRPVCLNPV